MEVKAGDIWIRSRTDTVTEIHTVDRGNVGGVYHIHEYVSVMFQHDFRIYIDCYHGDIRVDRQMLDTPVGKVLYKMLYPKVWDILKGIASES